MGSHHRPPALRPVSPRSYQADDLDAFAASLEAAGATPQNPAPAEWRRYAFAGGLCLVYSTGAVVVAGATPRSLLALLDKWAGASAPAAALLTKRSATSWHSATPGALLAALSTRDGCELWRPRAGDTRCRNELGRIYIREGTRWEAQPSAIVVSTDGWVRTNGADTARAAALLDAIAEQAPAVEDDPDAPAVEQMSLFLAEVAR
jgi:hypothetical protein